MNILMPFIGDSVGGSHISALELYSSLIDKDVSVFIVIHEDNGPLAQYLRSKKIPFFVLSLSGLAGETPGKLSIIIGILSNFFCLGRFIKSHKVDIVHGNDLRVNLSWSLPARFFARGFVWHQRTLLSTSKFWLLVRYLCSFFISISDVVMKSAPRNIPSYKKRTIYNPFNVASLMNKDSSRKYVTEAYNIPYDCFLLGYVGRIIDYKNIDFLIKNFSDIYHNSNSNIYLIIVGTGSEEYVNRLKRYSSSMGVSGRIIFTGFLKNTNEIMASLDVLVASSTMDAFGRSIVEAMLQKTPVLAAKYGGHIDIINDKVNGMFYEPSIKGDFSNKISIIMKGVDINILSDNAYQFAKTRFSLQEHLTNIISIYRYLLKN